MLSPNFTEFTRQGLPFRGFRGDNEAMQAKGAIAAGHPETAAAAAAILGEGGNAFDAVLAGLLAAVVAEPVLNSLGGGGFLLARRRQRDGQTILYDFFAHTPKRRLPVRGGEFFPILADFGTAQQEFHIGMASMATPGTVKGLFRVHGDLASMPMARIIEPAVALARNGVRVNRLQAYIFGIVEKIYTVNDACRAVYGSRRNSGGPIGEGELFTLPDFAATLQALATEGEDLFYRGEIARRIVGDCHDGGGALRDEDLRDYRVMVRRPLELAHGGARLFANPPPSTGGILVAFALELLGEAGLKSAGFGSARHLERLATAMMLTNKARIDSRLNEADPEDAAETLLNPEFLETYRRLVLGRPAARRGTTHISVIDAKGNAAALSLSNGEGSGYIVPGTGIMMNNMLGEEDINPSGFHQWPEDTRMSSMMAPCLLVDSGGGMTVFGSGGSNRIRTAVLQVILNLLEFGMSIEEAVTSPRIHFENGLLSIESGFRKSQVKALLKAFPSHKLWPETNLFFGGVHSVRFDPRQGRFEGVGDPRRGGVALTV